MSNPTEPFRVTSEEGKAKYKIFPHSKNRWVVFKDEGFFCEVAKESDAQQIIDALNYKVESLGTIGERDRLLKELHELRALNKSPNETLLERITLDSSTLNQAQQLQKYKTWQGKVPSIEEVVKDAINRYSDWAFPPEYKTTGFDRE